MAHEMSSDESIFQEPVVADLSETATGDATGIALVQSMNGRQVLVVLVWTLLADLLIFRSHGYMGFAVFFCVAPLLFLARPWFGINQLALVTVFVLIGLVAFRTAWLGSGLTVLSGMGLLIAMAMACSGYVPYVMEGIVFAGRAAVDGLLQIAERFHWDRSAVPIPLAKRDIVAKLEAEATQNGRHVLISWLLPLLAAIVFGGIFVVANPDLFEVVSAKLSGMWEFAWSWIEGVSVWEIAFCLCAFVLGTGLFWPAMPLPMFGPERCVVHTSGTKEAPLFAAYRNTLLTLIALFGIYLVFEFVTLWQRDFPPGFYYAGYAHQGAAWLTFALALATGLLSLTFSGQVLNDTRLESLRKLSWVWAAQNLLLAAAVYNRLLIYVGYNGMTRMRTIGFFGITVVIIGFTLVLFKIAKNRGFWWLIRAQLIALVLTVMAYGLFPVDWVAHRYNAHRVASGYLHPSVMIAVKPITDEGIAPLIGLIDAKDPIIREGVLALLADRQRRILNDQEKSTWHWTKFQWATSRMRHKLREHQTAWAKYIRNTKARRDAIADFQEYAMQWY